MVSYRYLYKHISLIVDYLVQPDDVAIGNRN